MLTAVKGVKNKIELFCARGIPKVFGKQTNRENVRTSK